jgi:hypothetical protein
MTLIANCEGSRIPWIAELYLKHAARPFHFVMSSATAEAHCAYESCSIGYQQSDRQAEGETGVRTF